MERAYSVLEVRSVDLERREIAGMATTPTPDRMGDVIEPRGATFANPLSLLLYHDHRQPVGMVTLSAPTDHGIAFTATLADIKAPGKLKDRIEEAWESIRAKLIRGVSIGFRVLDDGIELLRTGGVRFTKIEILELSLVAIPANSEATIATIKSIDAQQRTATGSTAGPDPSGVADKPRAAAVARTGAKLAKKTTAEQISAYEATRQANASRMKELMDTASEKGETLSETESEEYDRLEGENKSIDNHLRRLKTLQAEQVAAAQPVNGNTQKDAAESRAGAGGTVVYARQALPPGIEFARVLMCRMASFREQGSRTPLQVAREWYPDNHRVHKFFEEGLTTRAAVPAATTTNAPWLGNLTEPAQIVAEFLEYLRPQTIIGKFGTNGIPALMSVPFNVRVNGQTSGGQGYWVGQGKAKPLTKFDTGSQTLLWAKVAAISVITEETARFSSPSAEQLVRNGLSAALAERLDIDFIDPAKAAVAGVSPASITNGVTPGSSTGTTADAVRHDIMLLISSYVKANQDISGLVLIMPNTMSLALGTMRNSLGQSEFPGVGVNGGTIEGIPVITSQYAAQMTGAGNMVIAVNARAIGLADDGQFTIDLSREASLEMSDAPVGDAGAGTGPATGLVSMFQTNSIALRAERFINWAKFRAGAVVYLDDVNWGGIGS